jgi:quinone-modifying oxidoreductase subunit QmoA
MSSSAILVVGGGFSGITAALEALKSATKCSLWRRTPSWAQGDAAQQVFPQAVSAVLRAGDPVQRIKNNKSSSSSPWPR